MKTVTIRQNPTLSFSDLFMGFIAGQTVLRQVELECSTFLTVCFKFDVLHMMMAFVYKEMVSRW